MGTELREQDDVIDSYLAFAMQNQEYFYRDNGTPKILTVDIEMSLARSYEIKQYEEENQEEEEEAQEQGLQLLQAANEDNNFLVTEILKSNPQLIWYRGKTTGYTVVHVAANGGHKRVLKALINYIKNYERSEFRFTSPLLIGDQNGNTPLHLALGNHHKEVAFALIQEMPPEFAYASVGYDGWGFTPLQLATSAGYRDLVADMLQRAPWSSLHQHDRDALLQSGIVHKAIHQRDVGMLKMVLDNLPTLVESEFDGCSPLFYAIRKGQLECIKELLSRCPNAINQVGEKGRSPLSYAAYEGHLDIVRYFLTEFPDYANKCDRDGSFPIHEAVGILGRKGRVDIVEELLSRCPETLYQINGRGQSILHIVVEFSRDDVLTYVKNTKPDELKQILHIKDNDGNTFTDLFAREVQRVRELKDFYARYHQA